MTIQEKLNKLANFYSQRKNIQLVKQAAIDTVLTDEVKKQLADIDLEFAGQFVAVDKNTADLEAEIKNEVIDCGASVKGEFLQAVYSKPRVSWDTKGLDGYAVAHPEVAVFKKSTGIPSVSIREVK